MRFKNEANKKDYGIFANRVKILPNHGLHLVEPPDNYAASRVIDVIGQEAYDLLLEGKVYFTGTEETLDSGVWLPMCESIPAYVEVVPEFV
jgi:hypothetical protein